MYEFNDYLDDIPDGRVTTVWLRNGAKIEGAYAMHIREMYPTCIGIWLPKCASPVLIKLDAIDAIVASPIG